jgi:hypothetical protein
LRECPLNEIGLKTTLAERDAEIRKLRTDLVVRCSSSIPGERSEDREPPNGEK